MPVIFFTYTVTIENVRVPVLKWEIKIDLPGLGGNTVHKNFEGITL